MELVNKRSVLALCVVDITLFIISLSLDVSVHRGLLPSSQGIWCGIFYLIAGCLGLVIIYVKQDLPIVKTAFIVSCAAALCGVIAAGLSGRDARQLSNTCNFAFIRFICDDVYTIWALVVVSILAAIINGIFAFFLYPNAYSAVAGNPA